MKSIFKILCATILLLGCGKAIAQPNVDLVLTGSPNMGTYAGFVLPATYDITLSNGTGTTVTAGHFQIVLSVPTGFQFDAYPALPTGWQYIIQPGANSVNLIPTQNVSGFPPAGIVSFHVPMHTTAAVNNQPYLGQIQILVPSFQDQDVSNNTPQGTVTVLNSQPLATDFTTFNVTAEGCKTNITWATGVERGNKYFSVERSTDGIIFAGIGDVDARGGNLNGAEYSFSDPSPASGKNFYRIKQYSTDDKSTTSQTKSVSFNCGNTKIELFPNPTTDMVNVKGLTGKNTIKIMTIAGHEIMKDETELPAHGMRVNALASGTYQVQVVKNNEIIFNGKFVKAE